MNIEFFLNFIKNHPRGRLFLASGARPIAKGMSEDEFDFKGRLDFEDLKKILETAGIFSGTSPEAFNFRKQVFAHGKKFFAKGVLLKDSAFIELSSVDEELFDLSSLILPGYVFDWAQASKGLILVYGSDQSNWEKFHLSFARFRAQSLAGSSLIFDNSGVDFVGKDDHLVSFSSYQKDFLRLGESAFFDYFSFGEPIDAEQSEPVLRLLDRGSLVSAPVPWNDLGQVWSEVSAWGKAQGGLSLVIKNLVGFVGINGVINDVGEKEYCFEVVPFAKDIKEDFQSSDFRGQIQILENLRSSEGYSFNQSLQALLLKRKIRLDQAYEVSPDPKELNTMLSEIGY